MNSFIRVAVDGLGKRMQTFLNTILGVDVHAEAVVLVDTAGAALTATGGSLSVRVANGASFDVPKFDYQAFTYIGSTNNISTQVFKLGGASGSLVATLTYAYVAAGAADDDLISAITQS